MRFSYLQKSATVRYKTDWGCFSPHRVPNFHYFPPQLASGSDLANLTHDHYGTVKIQLGKLTEKEKQFENLNQFEKTNDLNQRKGLVVSLPRDLQYIEIDNIGLSNRKSFFQVMFNPNNLLFLNLSNNPAVGPDVNGVIYGLDRLRVLDVSRSGYRKLNPLLLEFLPALTHLYASGNSLPQYSFISIGKIRNLQYLDISDNAILSLNRDIFLEKGNSEQLTWQRIE